MLGFVCSFPPYPLLHLSCLHPSTPLERHRGLLRPQEAPRGEQGRCPTRTSSARGIQAEAWVRRPEEGESAVRKEIVQDWPLSQAKLSQNHGALSTVASSPCIEFNQIELSD